jgi:peptidyl-prolyl cis-trans isomerase B (cyclophilin B)
MVRKYGIFVLCGLLLAGFTAQALGGDTVAKKKKKKSAVSSTDVRVEFVTTQGNFTAELFSDVPITTKNFIDLVSSGFYNGLTFHRYEPGFVIQGGDPLGTGMGGSGKTIPLEITKHQHDQGALAMARSQDPNSASSQFYICLAPAHFLDNNYAVFGQVIEGMDNVLKLRKGDKMLKVTLVANPAKK